MREAALGHNALYGDYRPNNKLTGSLGVFEHWNNAHDMKYSRNMGENKGIVRAYTMSCLFGSVKKNGEGIPK